MSKIGTMVSIGVAAEEAEALGLRSRPLKPFVLDYAKTHQVE